MYFNYIKTIKLPFIIHSSKAKPLSQIVPSRTPLKLKSKFKLEEEISNDFFS